MKKNQSQKKSGKNGRLLVIEIICAVILFYAAFLLYLIFQDYHIAAEEYEILSEQAVSVIDSQEMDEKQEDPKEESILDQPYDYEVPSYEVNLKSLKEQNEDTVGWIILPDSKISYPIVKSRDNEDYLTKTFEGQTANSGAIFMDMNCQGDFTSQNTIIYGHNMKNGSMFRALNNLTDKEYFWRHHIFCIDTGNGFKNYEIISCYETDTTDLSSWQIGFESSAAYEQWLQNIVKRCNYDCADYDVTKNTITLSTCRGKSGGPGRFIVHLQEKNQ